ncbi:MAG TPA: hypothetical protein VFE24_09480, partial [Pirellulales bacterium]|nr:hypothetical protein [Pirellulales bacterium]
QEFAEDGSLLRAAGYREGKLHGPNQVFDKKQTVKDEFWVDGKLLLPKSAAQMKAEFAAIDKRAVESVGDFPAQEGPWKPRLSDPAAQRDREAALRILQAYRYLCDLPYRDLVLDREEIAHAEAASDLLVKLGRLEHTPANPGWPDDQYKFAYRGTSSSNLHQGGKAMAPTVHGYMADADENNMKTLGHRRWCLNPAMGKTGFGQAGDFGAMWSFDSSRRDVRDYDQVAFPPIGLTPTVCFKDNYPWSLTLNPKKFAQPKESEIKVKVFPARLSPKTGDVEKLGAALELNYFHVNNDGYGVNNCIIFRPTGVQAVANSAYWVEVTGIKTKKNVDAPLEYFVGFFSLNP